MIVVITNNKCLKGTKKNIKKVIEALNKVYCSFIVVDYTYLNTLFLEKIKVVLICGGDGSINNIINELAHLNVLFGIIPLGTGNDLSNNLNIKNLNSAILKIINNQESTIFVNKANDRLFTYGISVGNISSYITNVKRRNKQRIGKFIYIFSCFKILSLNKKIYLVKVNEDIKFYKCKGLIITNSKFLGGFKINLLTTRKYQLISIRNFFDLVKLFLKHRKNYFEIGTDSKVEIKGNFLDCCLDGEPYKTNFLKIRLRNKRIRIII